VTNAGIRSKTPLTADTSSYGVQLNCSRYWFGKTLVWVNIG